MDPNLFNPSSSSSLDNSVDSLVSTLTANAESSIVIPQTIRRLAPPSQLMPFVARQLRHQAPSAGVQDYRVALLLSMMRFQSEWMEPGEQIDPTFMYHLEALAQSLGSALDDLPSPAPSPIHFSPSASSPFHRLAPKSFTFESKHSTQRASAFKPFTSTTATHHSHSPPSADPFQGTRLLAEVATRSAPDLFSLSSSQSHSPHQRKRSDDHSCSSSSESAPARIPNGKYDDLALFIEKMKQLTEEDVRKLIECRKKQKRKYKALRLPMSSAAAQKISEEDEKESENEIDSRHIVRANTRPQRKRKQNSRMEDYVTPTPSPAHSVKRAVRMATEDDSIHRGDNNDNDNNDDNPSNQSHHDDNDDNNFSNDDTHEEEEEEEVSGQPMEDESD